MRARPLSRGAWPWRCEYVSACRRSDRMSSFLVVLLHLLTQLPKTAALPTGLDHPGHFPGQSQRTKADAAQLEFSQIAAWPPAAQTTVAMPALQLGRLRRFGERQFLISCNLRSSGHEILTC